MFGLAGKNYFAMICVIVLTCLFNNGQASSDPNDKPSSQHDYEHDSPGEPLSPTDFSNAERIVLHQVAPNTASVDPIELAGLFEGDIVLDEDEDDLNHNGGRNAVTVSYKKWRNGIVPYRISAKFSDDERATVARAILEFERQTCIQFQPWNNEVDYIMFTKGEGCSSAVGRAGDQQEVSLGEGCVYPGIVMHELMHVIGFWHEQNRQDRDDHITVHYDNIQDGAESNFRKLSWSEAQNLSVPYDTSSILHYGPFAFTKNRKKNKKTITSKYPNQRMGQRENFTETDVYKINKLYNCRRTTRNKTDLHPNPGQESTTTESPTATTEKCVDNHENCRKWANNGECEKNPNWMLVNCKLSCNQCGESCTDKNKNCEYWAANGECSKNSGYMHVYCAKSCKRC